MKKLLITAALCAASAGAWAQTFELLSDVSGTIVGSVQLLPNSDNSETTYRVGVVVENPIYASGFIAIAEASFENGQITGLRGGGSDDSSTTAFPLFYSQQISFGGTTFSYTSQAQLYPSGELLSFYEDRGTIVFASAVPEPATYALLGLGLAAGMARYRRRAATGTPA